VNPSLQAIGISAYLGQSRVLHDLNITLAPARWTSIVGPNGAGKSTLLKVLAGLLPCTGQVSLMGQPLQSIAPRLRARQLAWLGQSESASDELTVLDVVLLGRLPHVPWMGQPGPSDLAAVERALRATQAWDWRHRPLGQLAGGERQRVLLARALAVEAKVLLMDEPLANLDPPHQSDWLCVAQSLVEMGCTVVSVLHEITMALHADDMVIMRNGAIIHHGACQQPLTHRALEAVFDHRIAVRAIDTQWIALPAIPATPTVT
jgi:iron complex transport system ATP-binding protein